jgi:hypothetical protein
LLKVIAELRLDRKLVDACLDVEGFVREMEDGRRVEIKRGRLVAVCRGVKGPFALKG